MTDNLPSSLTIVHSVTNSLAIQSAACKLLGVALATVSLFLALLHGGSSSLLWAAAPIGFLGLVDAACLVEAQRMVKLSGKMSTKDQMDPAKSAEILRAQVEGPGYPMILTRLFGVFSLSVWPFYLGLAGVMALVWHGHPPEPSVIPPVPAKEVQPANLASSSPLTQSQQLPNNPTGSRAQPFAGQGQRPPGMPSSFPPGGGVRPPSFPPNAVNRSFHSPVNTSLPNAGKPGLAQPINPVTAPTTPATPMVVPPGAPATAPSIGAPSAPTAASPAKAP